MNGNALPPSDDDAPARILVVEDDPGIFKAIRRMLLPAYECIHMPSAEAAIEHLGAPPLPDVLLVDVGLPGMSGLELVAMLDDEYPELVGRTVLMTGSATPGSALDAATTRPWLFKPFSPGEIKRVLREILGAAPAA